MKIVVTGTRGIPGIQGGVETHCQELYPRIAAMGHDVTVIRRTPYVSDCDKEYSGVRLIDVYAPRKKSLEAIVHTFLAIIKARRMNADILHIHAIGPAIMAPFARMLGLKVVMTNHGPDYDRQKWGRMAKAILKTGERFGTRFSNKVIVISRVIQNILADRYGRTDTNLIYNGVNPTESDYGRDYTDSLGLEPQHYILAMGRFVKEKGFHDLINAYNPTEHNGFKLVIAGDADHPDHYSRQLKDDALRKGVILTGFINGRPLKQLLSNAALFVMPSYHEGLPIALLEAMSHRLDVAVSDIPANRLDCLKATDHFPVGDTDAINRIIGEKLNARRTPRQYNLADYDWDRIARQTESLYQSIL